MKVIFSNFTAVFRSNPATGCWRWLWVLCQTTAGDAILCPELLRGVWQRWRHDECGRVPHVLLSGRKARSLFYHHISTDSWAFSCIFHHLTSSFLSDPEAVRKKSQVPVRRGEFRTTRHSSPHQSGTKKEVSGWPRLLCSSPGWSLASVLAGCLKHSQQLVRM